MFIVGEEKCRQGYMLLTDNHCLHMPPKMFSICTVSPSRFLNTSCLSHVEFVVFRLDVAISIFSFFLLNLFLFLFFHMYLKEAMVIESANKKVKGRFVSLLIESQCVFQQYHILLRLLRHGWTAIHTSNRSQTSLAWFSLQLDQLFFIDL